MMDLILKKGRDWSVRRHHPWIFSGALETLPDGAPAPASGDFVRILSADREPLGFGSFSPASQIRVRMLSFDPKVCPDDAFVRARVAGAVAARRYFNGPAVPDAAARLVNAESDGLPGVVADAYAGHVVLQLTSAFAERVRPSLVAALMDAGACGVCVRNDVDVRAKEGLSVGGFETLAGAEPPETIVFAENGVKFLVDVRRGHKTGYYLDQREARRLVGRYAAGETLNCFAYTGGFGHYAALNRAAHVTQVDVSAEVLRRGREIQRLNGIPDEKVTFVEEDVFKFLRTCRDAGRTFDTIVLDPPKFAESKAQVMKAARGYKDINLLAMKLLRPGGVLATFSCSGAMTPDLFDKVLAEAAQDARRDFQVLARTQQAEDHPVALAFPEGLYLKGVILRAIS